MVHKSSAVAASSGGSGGSGFSLNSITGAVNLVAGSNVTITPSGQNITIAASGSGGGGITRSINSISANTNLGSTALTDYVYFCTATLIATLPTAVGNTNRYTVANQSTGTITLASAGGAINGNIPLTQQYMSYDLISDNTNWNIC